MEKKGLLLERGKNNQQASAHLFTHRIQCGNCQRYFRHINSSGKPYWVCPNVGKDAHSCRTEFIKEDILKIISINVISKLYINRNEIINQIIAMLREIEYTQLLLTNIVNELEQLNQRLAGIESQQKNRAITDSRMAEIDELLGQFAESGMEYDDILTRRLVSTIHVKSAEEIEITFKDGKTRTENMQ